jgi:hypothetical protein
VSGVERQLRQSAADVAATVAAGTPVPPFRPPTNRGRVAVAALLLAVVAAGATWAVAIRDTGPDDQVTAADGALVDLRPCEWVVALVSALEAGPTTPVGWQRVAGLVDHVDASRPPEGTDAGLERRYERLVLIAGLAAEEGRAGRQLAASTRSGEAIGLAAELLRTIDNAACAIALPEGG